LQHKVQLFATKWQYIIAQWQRLGFIKNEIQYVPCKGKIKLLPLQGTYCLEDLFEGAVLTFTVLNVFVFFVVIELLSIKIAFITDKFSWFVCLTKV
jgi:hypothetical protein